MSVAKIATLSLTALCVMGPTVFAEGDEASTETETSFLEALTEGTVSADLRFRYEHAAADGKLSSDAFTIRPRLGYLTAPYKGITGFLEFEHVEAVPDDGTYNAAGLNEGQGDRAVIADVEGTEVNQAWLAVTCPLTGVDGKLGRQRIKLDNDRFIGNVGWRQNEQTYDSVVAKYTILDQVDLFYSYVWGVARIFGQDNGSQPAGESANAAQYHSYSHLVNAALTSLPYARVVGYAYLLDLGNATVGSANSADTYGLRLKGSYEVKEGQTLGYTAEYAKQSDNSATTADVSLDADYMVIDLSGSIALGTLGAGYEVLGSDEGNVAFQTPLATLHAFNGWADVFLTTPEAGLKDFYIYVKGTLPGEFKTKLVYHDFSSDEGSTDYGTEFDAVVSRDISENLNVLAKYATYSADDSPDNPRAADVDKFIVEATFSF